MRGVRSAAACMCVAAALLAAGAASARAQDAKVSISGLHFKPSPVMVSVGDTVTWVNEGFLLHTVTSDAGEFDSGTIHGGGQYSLKFTKPGTFAYSCSVHPEMHGSVMVSGGGSSGMGEHMGEHGSPPPPTTPAQGTANVSLRLSGARRAHRRVRVSSSRPGASVLLELYSREHFAWLQVAHATLDSSGGATFKLRARVHRQVRAVVVGGPGEGPSISAPLRT